jgi:hypothetical protein
VHDQGLRSASTTGLSSGRTAKLAASRRRVNETEFRYSASGSRIVPGSRDGSVKFVQEFANQRC